jgi:hypothetical protein
MVRVVLTYGPTSSRLRAELSGTQHHDCTVEPIVTTRPFSLVIAVASQIADSQFAESQIAESN